jgi:CubicO group peptidase (beta-lactamase class C family)
MNTSLEQPEALSTSESGLFASLGDLFESALKKGVFAGASLLVGTPREILFHRTWGCCRRDGNPIDFRTNFDLASLTKPLITAPLYVWSISQGRIQLDDSLSRFFPAAVLPPEKRSITIKHLLNHSSGLSPYRPYYKELISVPSAEKREGLLRRILDESLISQPGTEAHYSDLGFQLLGIILETVWDKPLDLLASEVLLTPGAVSDPSPGPSPRPSSPGRHQSGDGNAPSTCVDEELGFRRLRVASDPTFPSEPVSRSHVSYAATELCPWRNRMLEGEVHDENAYSLEGVAGHAGLFGTAFGVYTLISSLWQIYRNEAGDSRWSRELLNLFWTRQDLVHNSTWALGFDTPSDKGSSAGVYFSPRSVGHLGFTGTSFWMDLEREILVILLTNRDHPTRENEKIREFRPLLHNSVMEAHHACSRH